MQLCEINSIDAEHPVSQQYPAAPTVVWIHGVNQSELTFAYLRARCGFAREIAVNYNSLNTFYNNLTLMVNQLSDAGPLFVVGHSLGGLYALHLVQHVNIVGAVSISTPFRGSSAADWAKYIVPNFPLFREVGRNAPPIVEAEKISINIPWTQIVSTRGTVPYLRNPNDGVVTRESMRHRSDVECVDVPHTHYEVVCSDIVAKIIKQQYHRVADTVQPN